MSSLQRVELDRRAVRHHVRVVHGGTGRPLEAISARLVEPAWDGWSLRRRGADVVLFTADRLAARHPEERTPPGPPLPAVLEVRVEDPAAAARFPLVDGERGVARVTLAWDADAETTLTLAPAPVRLEVELMRKNGTLVTGRPAVQARANGHTVPLAEDAPGTYAGDAVWRPQPYRIFDGGAQRGTVAIDYQRAVTRVRLIVP